MRWKDRHKPSTPLERIAAAVERFVEKFNPGGGGIAELKAILIRIEEKLDALGVPSRSNPATIHVTEVQLKEREMPPVDHMPPLQLPTVSVRARLSVVDPRKADGSRATNPTWKTSDETQLPLEALPDTTAKDVDGNEILDPVDGLPLTVFQTFANTPLTAEEVEALPEKVAGGTVTWSAPGMADVDIRINYSDPPLGHAAITAAEAPEA